MVPVELPPPEPPLPGVTVMDRVVEATVVADEFLPSTVREIIPDAVELSVPEITPVVELMVRPLAIAVVCETVLN